VQRLRLTPFQPATDARFSLSRLSLISVGFLSFFAGSFVALPVEVMLPRDPLTSFCFSNTITTNYRHQAPQCRARLIVAEPCSWLMWAFRRSDICTTKYRCLFIVPVLGGGQEAVRRRLGAARVQADPVPRHAKGRCRRPLRASGCDHD
jgi:hypothetical protein